MEIQKHVANYLVAQNPVRQSWQDEGSYVWEYEHRSPDQVDNDKRSTPSDRMRLSLKGNHQRNLPDFGPLIVAGASTGGLLAGPPGAAAGAVLVCTMATIHKVSGDIKEMRVAKEFRRTVVNTAEIRERRHQPTNNSQSTALSRIQENRHRDDRHAPTTQSSRRQLSDRGNQRQLDYHQSSEDDSNDWPGRQSDQRQLSDRGKQRRLVYHESSEDDSDDRPGRQSGRRQVGNNRDRIARFVRR
jgi:hypothetical protein